MLELIRYMRDKYLSPDEFIASIKKGSWMRTNQGVKPPAGSFLNGNSWMVASVVSDIPFIDQEYYGDSLLEYKKELQLLDVVTEFNGNYQIVVDHLKSSISLSYMNSDSLILLLNCIRNCTSKGKVVAVLQAAQCVKTNGGFKYPSECFLHDPIWGFILLVFDGFPYIDGNFYKNNILIQYKSELSQIGVVVELDAAAKAFVKAFKEKTSRSSFIKEHVFSFLACYRELRKTRVFTFPADFRKCITEEKWLRTRLATYMSPRDCILFGSDWEPIAKITILPFIDDSDKWYGKEIHKYKEELSCIGVVTDIKDSARFVFSHIYFPTDVNQITSASVFSLLNIIRHKLEENASLPESFLKKISEKAWLKTTFGYMSPSDCILYSCTWAASLEIDDGPFIDEVHYGPLISKYEKELRAIGVSTDIASGTSLVARHLTFHSNFDLIKRIYSHLEKHNWKPEGEASALIWIPNRSWVSPSECVLYNKDCLFLSRLIVLEKHYESKLLSYFGRAFGVRSQPSLDDYCRLWKDWESSVKQPLLTECCSFWSYVVKHWNLKTEKILAECLSRVPACSSSVEMQLIKKCDVFVPDDLLLKDLFWNSSQLPLFVWTPRGIPHSKILEIYRSIGVRTISSAVVKAESLPSASSLISKETSLENLFIGKGLVMLILGFLADPALEMNPQSRHETVQRLLNVTALETDEPITMRMNLALSSGDTINVNPSRMIYWDKNENKLYAQKLDRSKGLKNVVEFATNFAQVLAEGLLWEKEDRIPKLAELIKFGFLMNFDLDAVMYYMKSENLLMFSEDEDFVASVYPWDRNVINELLELEISAREE